MLDFFLFKFGSLLVLSEFSSEIAQVFILNELRRVLYLFFKRCLDQQIVDMLIYFWGCGSRLTIIGLFIRFSVWIEQINIFVIIFHTLSFDYKLWSNIWFWFLLKLL